MNNNFDNTLSSRNAGDLNQDTFGQTQGAGLGQGLGQTQGTDLGQTQGQGLGSNPLDNSYGQGQTQGQGLGQGFGQGQTQGQGFGQGLRQGPGSTPLDDNSYSTGRGGAGNIIDNSSSAGYTDTDDNYARKPSTGEKIKGTIKEMTGKVTNNHALELEGEAQKRGEL